MALSRQMIRTFDPLQRDRQHPPGLSFHLLGNISWDECLALQRRLVFEAETRERLQKVVLLCEHPPLITVGRGGSRAHVRMSCESLRRRGWKLTWTGRGGGCIPHTPGQLSIYPIVPLERLGWTVGRLARCLQSALVATLDSHDIDWQTANNRLGVWGRRGQLAAVGLAVRNGVSWHGLHLNVNPPLDAYRVVDTTQVDDAPGQMTTMTSLVAEQGRSATMQQVRTTVIESLGEALQCEDYSIHTGPPL